jgi:hypothetical protein
MCQQAREEYISRFANLIYPYVSDANLIYPQARDKYISRFTSDATTRVFLISLKAGGVALNLTVASAVFIMDPWWNPAAEFQVIFPSLPLS